MHPHTKLLQKAVEQTFHTDWEILLTKRRPYKIVLPRKIFIFLHQVDLGSHPTDTSAIFGYDRTTAIQHKKDVGDKNEVGDPDIVNGLKAVRTKFHHLKCLTYGTGLQDEIPKIAEGC